jgi:hypothetical protein
LPSLSKKLEDALIGTGLIQSVWHCVSTPEGEATALCRAVGKTGHDKEQAMEALARLVVPAGVFIAKQFVLKEGRFGYCWNVSIFTDEHLLSIQDVHLPPPVSREESAAQREEAREPREGWRTGLNEEGEEFYFMDFPLPHAPEGDRNAPSDGRGDGMHLAPLGHGRGASRTKSSSRR